MMPRLRLLMMVGLLLGPVGVWAGGRGYPPPAVSGTDVPAVAPLGKIPTEAEAEAAYDAARKMYRDGAVAANGLQAVSGEVVIMGDPNQLVVAGGKRPDNVALENIRVVMDVDNTTLKDVFGEIVGQAATFTGPWTVKWRLKPENMEILDERVNLTAEAPFGQFVNLLGERVKNMTGVQLFVTTFKESRVILVTDTAN